MPDVEVTVEAVRKALNKLGWLLNNGTLAHATDFIEKNEPELLPTLAEATRRYLASEDAPCIWWCETHESAGTPPHCRYWIIVGGDESCHMDERLLLSPFPTKET